VAGPLALAMLGVALAVTLGLVVGDAGATVPAAGQFQANNSSSATLSDARVVDADTVEFAVASDAGVTADSVDGDDFQVSDGRVSSASAAADGDDALVTLYLERPVDSDVLTVAFAEGANVTDGDGARLDTDGARAELTGMDGVGPRLEAFDVSAANGTTVDVTVAAHETIDATTVSVTGPANVTLGRGNFTASANGTRLNASVALPAAGDYRATLDRLVDEHGNERQVGRIATVATTDRPPTAVAGVDFGASRGSTLTLDASRSTAADPIESITWDLGDGAEATGERVTHRYQPGNYTATVTVTDADGDVGRDRLALTVQGNGSAESIGSVATVAFATNETAVDGSALVDVADPADTAVRIARENATTSPLARHDGVALESLSVTLWNRSRYGLAIQVDGPSTVGDVPNATRVLGGVRLVHDVSDADVAGARLTIAVERDRLPDGADPASVALFRFHDDAWTRLNTTRVDDPQTAGPYRYHVRSPGLSRFAVATASNASAENATDATPTPTATPTATPTGNTTTETTASLRVVNATANRTTVSSAQAVRVSATVDNPGSAAAPFTAGLSVNGTVVDARTVTVPAGGNRTVALNWTANATGSYPLRVNGTTAGTVTVGDGGGLVASALGLVGFLPLGLFQTVLTYLGGVLVAGFLALKSFALFMGY